MPQGHNVSLLDEERYRLLVDAISDYAIYMLDAGGRVVSWNAGAQRFTGYEAREILGEHFSRFYTVEDRLDRAPERALQAAATQGRFVEEGWRLRKDATRFFAHIVIDPIWCRSGELLGFAKVTRDLTERRSAEADLKRSEQQFQRLVEGVTDYALYMLDPNGYVSSWNAGAERIKGYTADEIVGRHFSQFYIDEDRAHGEPAKSLETARRDGRFEKEGLRQRKDGSSFVAHVILDAIRSETGEIIGFAKITRDITEKVASQAALAKTREELFQSQKMEAIGQLTGGIAHDFNNLLMAVLGSLEILKKRMPEDPQLIPLVDNAIQGAERGAALTQRLLAFSRRQDLNMQAIDLATLVGGMRDFVSRSLGGAADIEIAFPADLSPVLSDPVQLESALLNLVVNARDAMMAKGGTIRITATEYAARDEADDRNPDDDNPADLKPADLKPGRYVCLSVADTGEGMSEETMAQATTPFFTTKGVGKGTGLGLSMVQGLTEQSGGRLTIDSVKGRGTTVSLYLPATDRPAADLAVVNPKNCPQASEIPMPPAPKAPQGRFTILAVDDDALVLMNTTLMLEDLGHTVVEAYNGADALKELKSGTHRFDLVVTDHSMPRMTGSELAAAIRQEWPDLPVVLATGYAELPSGGDTRLPRLPKPFSQGQLQDVIAQVLGAGG